VTTGGQKRVETRKPRCVKSAPWRRSFRASDCTVINETNVSKESKNVLWTIFVILLVLWLLGLVTSYTFGGFVHILLILAVVVLIFQLVAGRRAI
jgi:hypothetical protein